MILYRPVGSAELELIARSGFRRFPPRLPEQPIFYPVLTLKYASQIAKEWNARGDQAGFVTRFEIDDEFAGRFPVQTVGARQHQELWVPAEQLDEFNDHIQGTIEVIERYFGDTYSGPE